MFYGDGGGGGGGGGAGSAPDQGSKEDFDELCIPFLHKGCVWKYKADYTPADSVMIETGISSLEQHSLEMCRQAGTFLRQNEARIVVWDTRIDNLQNDERTGDTLVRGYRIPAEGTILIWLGQGMLAADVPLFNPARTLAHEALHGLRPNDVTEQQHQQIRNDAQTCVP